MHVQGSVLVGEAYRHGHSVSAIFTDGTDWKHRIAWALRLHAAAIIRINEIDHAVISAVFAHGTMTNRWTARLEADARRNRTIRFMVLKPQSTELTRFADSCFEEISSAPHLSVPLELLASEERSVHSPIEPAEAFRQSGER